jgi:hypothetical protein
MPMTTKTMEFEHLIAKYDYRTGELTLFRKDTRGGDAELDGYLLDVSQAQELREAFEGIGQQIKAQTTRPR